MARRELGPATLAVSQAVAAALTEGDTHLLVGCSGGPDSLALAFGALRTATTSRRQLTAMVVDHALQPGLGRCGGASPRPAVRARHR